MLNWLFGRDLSKVLNETKKISVSGVRFTIKKVNMLNYLDGSKVLIQSYDTHKTSGQKAQIAASTSENKIKKHYADVLLAGVVTPKLVGTKKEADEKKGYFVEDLFIDWEMVVKLYTEIMNLTYGKKKVQQLMSQVNDLQNSIS